MIISTLLGSVVIRSIIQNKELYDLVPAIVKYIDIRFPVLIQIHYDRNLNQSFSLTTMGKSERYSKDPLIIRWNSNGATVASNIHK